jgi:hypothetical protein
MNKNVKHRILALSIMLLLAVGYAHAQEAGNSEVQTSEKHSYSYGGDSEAQNVAKLRHLSKVDSAAFMPINSSASDAKKAQKQSADDDSVLSFNFLYYIIRKYKMQDIID